MATIQNANRSGTSWLSPDSIMGIFGQVSEVYLQSREQSVRQAEARKETVQRTSQTVAQAASALRQNQLTEIIKWSAIGIVGVVVGSKLVKFVSKQVKGT